MENIVPDRTRRHLTLLGLCAALLLPLTRPAVAAADQAPLRMPSGEIVLRLEGVAAQMQNLRGKAAFDLKMLQDIAIDSFTTRTPWAPEPQTFRGIPLIALLDRVGITEGELIARASNDYRIAIPVSDAVKGGPLIAWEVDGRRLDLRSRGPLWLIYPFDSDARWKTERIYSSSIWQLHSLEWVAPALPHSEGGQ